MQSLLMTVLSGAAHAPEQYVVYGPCGYTRVYYAPLAAYYPAEERGYAEVVPPTKKNWMT